MRRHLSVHSCKPARVSVQREERETEREREQGERETEREGGREMTTPSYIPNLRPTQIDNPTTFGRAIFCNPTLRNLSWVGEKVGQDRLARLKQSVKRGLRVRVTGPSCQTGTGCEKK